MWLETRRCKPSSWPCMCETYPKGNVPRVLTIIVALLGRYKATKVFSTILNVNSIVSFPIIGISTRVNTKIIPKQLQVYGFKDQFCKDENSSVFSSGEQKSLRWKKKQNSETCCCGDCISDYWSFIKGWKPKEYFYFRRGLWILYNSVSIYYCIYR